MPAAISFRLTPGAEAIADIGHDAATKRIGFIEMVKGPAQFLPHFAIHGILRFGPVQRDDVDAITLFGFDGVERHSPSSKHVI